MPFSSRPGMARLRGDGRTTRQHNRIVFAQQVVDAYIHTYVGIAAEHTPSSSIRAIRRSITHFSSLKSGMP
jgi:hypothetical protein